MTRAAARAFALIVSLGAAGLVPGPSAQHLRLPEDDKLIIDTTLEDLRATPAAFKAVWVRFDIQFASMGQLSNPFFTRFVPSEYANFHGWAGDQPIWRRDAYEDVFGNLFVAKDTDAARRIYELKLYDRVRVTALVQNTFQDAPWIEVVDFQPLVSKVNTGTLAHVFRGERYMHRREWRKAIAELKLAPSTDKPAFLRAAVHENLAVCHLRLGEADTARSHLRSAVGLKTPDVETRQLVAQAQADPRSLLDHAIDRDSIAEADRPLWEAFEEAGDDVTTTAAPGR